MPTWMEGSPARSDRHQNREHDDDIEDTENSAFLKSQLVPNVGHAINCMGLVYQIASVSWSALIPSSDHPRAGTPHPHPHPHRLHPRLSAHHGPYDLLSAPPTAGSISMAQSISQNCLLLSVILLNQEGTLKQIHLRTGLGEGRGSKLSNTEPRLPPENTGRQTWQGPRATRKW
eukprot:435948-Hanusia_phi.AAC.4